MRAALHTCVRVVLLLYKMIVLWNISHVTEPIFHTWCIVASMRIIISCGVAKPPWEDLQGKQIKGSRLSLKSLLWLQS